MEGEVAASKRLGKATAAAFLLVVLFEILFMISPFALHFYSAYGPALNVLHESAATAWLTQFYLAHFSETGTPLLDGLPAAGWLLVPAGLLLFFAGAIPVYVSKLRRSGPVTFGVYGIVRHPQYAGFAVTGLGLVLIWPRFLVLLSYVTMLFLYAALARSEEKRCLARFGNDYRAYLDRTGRFLPGRATRWIPRLLPESGIRRTTGLLGLYGLAVAAAVGLGFALREASLSRISASFQMDAAILSPAVLTPEELAAAYRTAAADPRVEQLLKKRGAGKLVVYVVPEAWYLPDLPIEAVHRPGGHRTPGDFDRARFKVLFTRARTHAPEASGRDIVRRAYGREPLTLARVDVAARAVTSIEVPPPHVVWGDIPTPMF